MTNRPYYGYIDNPFLDSLELSVRAGNVLRNMGGVNTIDDFMALTKEQVMALKGAGMRTWGEIKTLQKNLRDGHPEVNAALGVSGGHSGEINFSYVNPGREALRDAAALAALPAIIAATSAGQHQPHVTDSCGIAEAIARDAWEIADAFIKARETKTG